MDPNANLAEQLSIARGILANPEAHTYGAVRLAELVEALDGWDGERRIRAGAVGNASNQGCDSGIGRADPYPAYSGVFGAVRSQGTCPG